MSMEAIVGTPSKNTVNKGETTFHSQTLGNKVSYSVVRFSDFSRIVYCFALFTETITLTVFTEITLIKKKREI